MKLPTSPGGKEAFRDFIANTVRYPDEARAAGIEGSVLVGYQVTDDGKVINAHIIKGLGYGCDEEALRVIGLLRFEKVKNRNVRVKLTTKTNIHFNINKPTVAYTLAESSKSEKPKSQSGNAVTGPSYTYTIEY